jgi:hypothetical protein
MRLSLVKITLRCKNHINTYILSGTFIFQNVLFKKICVFCIYLAYIPEDEIKSSPSSLHSGDASSIAGGRVEIGIGGPRWIWSLFHQIYLHRQRLMLLCTDHLGPQHDDFPSVYYNKLFFDNL